MGAKIPEITRKGVIDSWLSGESTQVTAMKNGVSEGSVTNIVEEYRTALGHELAEILRSLAIAVSKAGMTAFQCAQGFRLVMIMDRMGISHPDKYEMFLSSISKRYVEAGQDPGRIFEDINELQFFFEKNKGPHGRTSIPMIETTIEEKKQVEKRLDESLLALRTQKNDLEKDISKLRIEKAMVEAELQWDVELKEKLGKGDFRNEDVSRFVRAAMLMKERRYNVFEIAEKFSKFEDISVACNNIKIQANEAQLRLAETNAKKRELQDQIEMNSQSLREISKLDEMGFRLPEFRQLRYLVDEIAQQRGIPKSAAVPNFFDDLQHYYYDYVFLKDSVAKFKSERDRLYSLDPNSYAKELLSDLLSSSLKKSQSYTSDMKNNSRQPNRESNANLQHESPVAENGNSLTEAVKDRHYMGLGQPSNPSLRKAGDADEFLEERLRSHSTPDVQAMQSEQMGQFEDTAQEEESGGDNTLKLLRYWYKRVGVPVQESGFDESPAKIPAGSRRPEITRADEQANQLNFPRNLGNGKILAQNKKPLKPPRPRSPHSIVRRLKNPNDS